MGDELSYQCKDVGKYPDCKGKIVISKKVLGLMLEKGESKPERCENCQKKHKAGKRETRQGYFQQDFNPMAVNASRSMFIAGAYTAHNGRQEKLDFIEPDSAGMQIRITDDHIRELYEKLYENQVVILASPTGTGKSVYVLYRLLEAPSDYDGGFVKTLIRQGQVIQTQPLTYATASIPETVSKKELGESGVRPMGIVGIRHRGREDYGKHNLGVVVTDGSLKNWIRDGHLGQYSLIMVDEAHKRSVNIDNLLTLLQYKLPLYPHLKVIIASATINLEEFKEGFERHGISTGVLDLSLTLEEKINYHVHYWKEKAIKKCDCWMCANDSLREKFWSNKAEPPEEAELPSVVSSFVIEILQNIQTGGILVFLTGEAVIEKTSEILTEKLKRIPSLKNVPVLPIYSRLGEGEVERRFNHNPGNKRVLLTTDIAETSHTLKDIMYVVESGYIKQFQWDPQDLTSTLPTIRHSQAGCQQRFGRVGRTQKGYVYCLYPREEFEHKFKKQTTPEIFRSPIDETFLTAKAAGISDELNFIGSPDDRSKFNTEVKRALSTIGDEGYTDEVGNITEDGLDIFRIPISPEKKALLDLADEQNCFIEMMTFLSMIETDKKDLRTGAEIFNLKHGLLFWDPRLTAVTKMNIWKIHNALKVGCIDDLDFVMKLAVCYLDEEKKGREEQWAEQNFLNLEAFKSIFKAQKEVMDIFLSKAEDRKMRELDFSLSSKLRMIMSIALKGRTVRILARDNKLIYEFQGDGSAFGVLHEACVGEWKDKESALLITATKKNCIVGGQQKSVSNACSLIKLEIESKKLNKEDFFDQCIFVGSRVSIIQKDGFEFIDNILQSPAQINVEYGEKLDFSMVMDDFLRKNYKPSIIFKEEDVVSRFKEINKSIRVTWKDERRSEDAKIVGWITTDGCPCAVVVPFDEREVIQKIKDQKEAEVTIERIFKGPEDNKGWVLATTSEGVEFPIESSALSLSFLNYGLKYLEGRQLKLLLKKVNAKGILTLSNIDNIVNGLRSLKQDVAERGEVKMEAIVDKIDLIRKIITVFTIDVGGLLYSFSIRQKTIPKMLKIGDEIQITVKLKEGNCFEDCYLEDYQAESLPKEEGWRYDEENERLFFPYFLDKEKLKDFDVEEEFKEKITKNSWAYGFWARMI